MSLMNVQDGHCLGLRHGSPGNERICSSTREGVEVTAEAGLQPRVLENKHAICHVSWAASSSAVWATLNILDTRTILRVDLGFYTGTIVWVLIW